MTKNNTLMNNNINTPATNMNNNINNKAMEDMKYIKTLINASFSLDRDEFFFEFGIYPEQIPAIEPSEIKLSEQIPAEIEPALSGVNVSDKKTSDTLEQYTPPIPRLNKRKLNAAVKREVINLLYPSFTKKRIHKELRSEFFADLSAFYKFFDTNYNLLFNYRLDFQDEVYRRITE